MKRLLSLLFPTIIVVMMSPLSSLTAKSAGHSFFVRPYQDSDREAIIDIFRRNIREEWSRYHDGIYLKPNVERYISRSTAKGSDMQTIPSSYLEGGGCFWVVVAVVGKETAKNQEEVVGMTGLQLLVDGSTGELRRMCLLPEHRRQGLGSHLVGLVQERAMELNLSKLTLSTPEHGEDVLLFYKKAGFVDTGKRQCIHGTPVKEVFLEWSCKSG